MKIRLVNTLVGGEILAEPVITGEQETLISKGTVLKPEYLDLLTFLGIDTVCIEDPYGEYEMPHHIFSNEKRSERNARMGNYSCYLYRRCGTCHTRNFLG